MMRRRIDEQLEVIREMAANHNNEEQQQQNHALQQLQRQYQQQQQQRQQMMAQLYVDLNSTSNTNIERRDDMELGVFQCNNESSRRARSMYYLAKAARDQLLIDKYTHAVEGTGENDVAFFPGLLPEPGSHIIIDEEYVAYEQQQQQQKNQQQDEGLSWIHEKPHPLMGIPILDNTTVTASSRPNSVPAGLGVAEATDLNRLELELGGGSQRTRNLLRQLGPVTPNPMELTLATPNPTQLTLRTTPNPPDLDLNLRLSL